MTTWWESLGTVRLLEAEPSTADTLVPPVNAPPTGQCEYQTAAKALSSPSNAFVSTGTDVNVGP